MEIHSLNSEFTGTKYKKEKKKGCHQLLTQVIYDFAENTTLNGIKYMAEKKSSVLERLFWIATVTLSAVLCILMVHKSYMKWETGVIITLKEHLVYANEMPFPAVTICPQAKIRQTIYNFTDMYNANQYSYDPPSTELHTLMVFCDFFNETQLDDVKTDIKKIFEVYVELADFMSDIVGEIANSAMCINCFNKINVLVISHKVAPKNEDVFEDCVWREKHNCIDAFRPVLTSDGVCYTFNSLSTDEILRKNRVHERHYHLNTTIRRNGWSLENNYHNSNQDTYPRRGRGNGANEDLFITLKEVTDRDFLCESHTRLGYKVYLHHPADLPQASLHYYAALPERTTSFALKLNVLDTSKEVTTYEPDVRQCYYPAERRLHFFKKYTSKNCQLECLANYTLHKCECVRYYMPRNNITRICKANNDSLCAEQALDEYADLEGLSDSQASQCRCLPSCYEINYDADIIITKFDQKEYEKRESALNNEVFNEYDGEDDEEYDEEYGDEYEEADDEAGDKEDDMEVEKEEVEEVENDDDKVKSDDLNKHVTRRSIDANNNATQSENDDNSDEKDASDSDSDNHDKNGNHEDEKNTSRLSEIRIYYRQPRFVAMERSEMFGLSQFLADCGGTLGLFLGFSFLTLAEIFYFFTLKLCCFQEAKGKKKEKCNCIETA